MLRIRLRNTRRSERCSDAFDAFIFIGQGCKKYQNIIENRHSRFDFLHLNYKKVF